MSWRLIFYINLPVAVGVLLISARHVPESRDPTIRGRLDVLGAAVFSLALAGLTYGLTEGASLGWGSPAVLSALIAGAALLVIFCVVELSQKTPLLPLGIFRSAQFSGDNAVTFVVYAGLGGALFLLPIQLQQVLGFSPFQAGISLSPITVIMLALSARSGALAARIGPRLQMSVGPLFVAAGLALLARVGVEVRYVGGVLPALVVLGFGLAVTVAPLTATALAAVPSEHSGVASAVNNDVARVGSLVAVAVLPSLAGITGKSYLHPAVFSAGFHNAVLIAASACVMGSIIAVLTIRNPDADRKPPPSPVEWQCGLDGPALCGAPAQLQGNGGGEAAGNGGFPEGAREPAP